MAFTPQNVFLCSPCISLILYQSLVTEKALDHDGALLFNVFEFPFSTVSKWRYLDGAYLRFASWCEVSSGILDRNSSRRSLWFPRVFPIEICPDLYIYVSQTSKVFGRIFYSDHCKPSYYCIGSLFKIE